MMLRQLALWAEVPPEAARAAVRPPATRPAHPPLVVVRDEAVLGEAAELVGVGPVRSHRRLAPVARPLPTPGVAPAVPRDRLSTGIADLDRFLGGGLPRGEIVEVAGGPSSGKATLAFGACLAALAAGGRAAWVDPAASFWPLAALEAGAPADRLVVVRPPSAAGACRAADILLGAAGAVDMVVVDLHGDVPLGEARLARLQRLAARGGAALVVLHTREAAASLGALVGLRLRVRRREGPCALEIAVVRHKRGPDNRTFLVPLHEPDRLRGCSTI
jgi:hypothetical protein